MTEKTASVRPLRVSDTALMRVLERSGIGVEEIRSALAAGLARAHEAATAIGARDYVITVDGLSYVVRDGVVTTVLAGRRAERTQALLGGGAR